MIFESKRALRRKKADGPTIRTMSHFAWVQAAAPSLVTLQTAISKSVPAAR
jgi:hypothetical protein